MRDNPVPTTTPRHAGRDSAHSSAHFFSAGLPNKNSIDLPNHWSAVFWIGRTTPVTVEVSFSARQTRHTGIHATTVPPRLCSHHQRTMSWPERATQPPKGGKRSRRTLEGAADGALGDFHPLPKPIRANWALTLRRNQLTGFPQGRESLSCTRPSVHTGAICRCGALSVG